MHEVRGTLHGLTWDTDEKPYSRLSWTSYIFRMPVRCARLYFCGMVRYQLYYKYILVHPFPGFQALYSKVIQIFSPSKLSLNIFFEAILVVLTVHKGLKYRINELPPTCVYISALFPRTFQDDILFSVEVLIRDSVVYYVAVNGVCQNLANHFYVGTHSALCQWF